MGDAWALRPLWLLGAIASLKLGGTVDFSGGAQRLAEQFDPTDPGTWVTTALLAALAALTIAVVVFIGLSARGALIRAGLRRARGETLTFRESWHDGASTAGDLLLYDLFVWGVLVLPPTLVGLGLEMAALTLDDLPMLVRMALGVGGGVILALTLIGVIVLFVVNGFAYRYLLYEDAPPRIALQRGWDLFRAHVVPCIAAAALGISAGVVAWSVLLIVLAPLLLAATLSHAMLPSAEAAIRWTTVPFLLVLNLVLSGPQGVFVYQLWNRTFAELDPEAFAHGLRDPHLDV